MSDPDQAPIRRQPLFDRIRAPLTGVVIGLGILGTYYFFFEKKNTDYETNRDARVIEHVAAEVQESFATVHGILDSLEGTEYNDVYVIGRKLPEERRPPSAIFTDVKPQTNPKTAPFSIERLGEREEIKLATNKVVATFDLDRFLKPALSQSAGVFDTILIVGEDGEVWYQKRTGASSSPRADLKVVRLGQMTTESLFSPRQTLKPSDLAVVSRHISVRLGEEVYELFSVPMRPKIEKSQPVKRSTWVVCGLVSSANFRASSLAVSPTVLCCIGGLILVLILNWPFLKIALMNAQHKLGLPDVIFLGFSGTLITAIICLGALDGITYRHVTAEADEQLETLARRIDLRFTKEVRDVSSVLDWATPRALAYQRTYPWDVTGLFGWPLHFHKYPWFQQITLIDGDGRQARKWVVDDVLTPHISVSERTYFTAPRYGARDGTFFDSRFTVQSLRSLTTGEPELVVSRKTQDLSFPVIAISIPTALSVMHPILPESFRFAIIDATGQVMLHSDPQHNTVENLFAETDGDPRLRSLVAARQNETTHVRYLGEDYVACVYPMPEFRSWCIVTLREERGLRAMNAEALSTALYFLLFVSGCGLFLVCAIVLFLPQYRAGWMWPDAARIGDYNDLSYMFLFLLLAAVCMFGSLGNGELFVMPFGFVPFAVVISYLYLLDRDGDFAPVKRRISIALSIVCVSFLLWVIWHFTERTPTLVSYVGRAAATLLCLIVGVWAVVRQPSRVDAQGRHALTFAYVSVASLLLLVVSVVPTFAFFEAVYRENMSS